MAMIGGLSGPFSSRRQAHCGRCHAMVEATFPWSGWPRVRKVFFGYLITLLLLSPFFYADMFVMLPSAMIFVFALGPVNYLARVQPTCLSCGGPVTETSLRVVAAAPAPARASEQA